jgi:hypothetical protein
MASSESASDTVDGGGKGVLLAGSDGSVVLTGGATALSSLPAWNASRLTALHEKDSFAELTSAIEAGYCARDPRVVNWCIDVGYRTGAVPVLQLLAQNMLRYKTGRVPTLEDLNFGVRCAGLLLLRVAQDVLACKYDLGKSDRTGIYEKYRGMVCHYVLRWAADVRPSPGTVADALSAWLEVSGAKMPLPVWTTCFELGIFAVTYYWQTPTEENMLAMHRAAAHVNETRAAVAAKFIAELSASASWDVFLLVDLSAFEPGARK